LNKTRSVIRQASSMRRTVAPSDVPQRRRAALASSKLRRPLVVLFPLRCYNNRSLLSAPLNCFALRCSELCKVSTKRAKQPDTRDICRIVHFHSSSPDRELSSASDSVSGQWLVGQQFSYVRLAMPLRRSVLSFVGRSVLRFVSSIARGLHCYAVRAIRYALARISSLL